MQMILNIKRRCNSEERFIIFYYNRDLNCFFSFFILINRLVCKFEGTQIVLDSTGVEYEEFKEKFTGKLHILA